MGAIKWGMWLTYLALFGLIVVLSGCSAHGELNAIKRSVDSRITYQYYKGKDWRYVGPLDEAKGNCAVFAYTYWRELINAGYNAHIGTCTVPNGDAHVFAVVDGMVLDTREQWVVKQGENCK